MMSILRFLSILFFVSNFRFSQARSLPEDHESYEAQLEKIVVEMSACMEKNLEPIMSQLSRADQSQWRDMGISALSSYIRQLNYIANQHKTHEALYHNPSAADHHHYDDHEDHTGRHDHGEHDDYDDEESSEDDSSEEIKPLSHPKS